MTNKTDSKEREALRSIGEEQAFEAWFKVDCPVEGANAKIAAKAAWKARASLAASAGSEPVARVNDDGFIVEIGDLLIAPGQKLYLHPSPLDGMAGWKWVPVEPTEEMLAAAHDGDREYTLRNFGDVMTVMQGPYDHWAAMIAAAPHPPTTSAGSGKGE